MLAKVNSRCYLSASTVGFHQKCHNPPIPISALQFDMPWKCSYCQRNVKCPFLTESLDVLQNLLSDDNDTTGDEEYEEGESENDDVVQEKYVPRQVGGPRKRKVTKIQSLLTLLQLSLDIHILLLLLAVSYKFCF